jgi:hypothetical protein
MLMMPLALAPLAAQKIENETASREHVVRVQTALRHLTVIEIAEPVTTVAVGSPEAFKIERRENKVFIEPLEENVATNLFIWTASTRLNYELVPAISDAGQMDFAIDYRPPEPQGKIAPPKSSDPTRCLRAADTERNVAEWDPGSTRRRFDDEDGLRTGASGRVPKTG